MDLSSLLISENSENDLLLSFLKTATDGMLLTTYDGTILSINTAAKELFNKFFTNKIVGERIFRFLNFPTSSLAHPSAIFFEEVLSARQVIYPTWKLPYDNNLPISLTINAIQIKETKYLILALRPHLSANPLTKQVITKPSLESNTLLQSTEKEKKLHLLLKNERELNRVKSKFISIASHEFRTPLTTILASADLIGRYAKQAGETHYTRHIDRIKSSIRNLTKILENFLSLDKLEEGQEANQPEEVHLPQLIEKIIEEARLTFRTGQTVTLDLQLSAELAILDASILRIILINLLNNASKYSKEYMPIDVSISNNEKKLYIKVKDQGIGIPLSDQPHIFTRFYRGQNTVTTGGAGLGLNVIQQYLKLVNGKIKFSSITNQHTIFEIWLPINITK